jgi:hypothetical protein
MRLSTSQFKKVKMHTNKIVNVNRVVYLKLSVTEIDNFNIFYQIKNKRKLKFVWAHCLQWEKWEC